MDSIDPRQRCVGCGEPLRTPTAIELGMPDGTPIVHTIRAGPLLGPDWAGAYEEIGAIIVQAWVWRLRSKGSPVYAEGLWTPDTGAALAIRGLETDYRRPQFDRAIRSLRLLRITSLGRRPGRSVSREEYDEAREVLLRDYPKQSDRVKALADRLAISVDSVYRYHEVEGWPL